MLTDDIILQGDLFGMIGTRSIIIGNEIQGFDKHRTRGRRLELAQTPRLAAKSRTIIEAKGYGNFGSFNVYMDKYEPMDSRGICHFTGILEPDHNTLSLPFVGEFNRRHGKGWIEFV